MRSICHDVLAFGGPGTHYSISRPASQRPVATGRRHARLQAQPSLPGTKNRRTMMERRLDKRFYRLAYGETTGLSDKELIAAVKLTPRNRPLNPTEFIQDALARKLMPEDFDPLGFQIHRPELWGVAPENWEIALHFLRTERADEPDWRRPFDAAFYRKLYIPQLCENDDATLDIHSRAHPEAYWSLDEALVRNGWRKRDWTAAFGHAYAEYHLLTDQLRTPAQELVHFIEHGWRELFAISSEHEFDLSYYSDFMGGTIAMAPAEAYRVWVENGLAAGAPANARAHLRELGLRLPCYPEGFDWRAYLEERPELVAFALSAKRQANRWDALGHLVEHGVSHSAKPLPITGDSLQNLLLVAADRFEISNKIDKATECYERALLTGNPSKDLLQHAGDHALRSGHPARALSCYRGANAVGAEGLWTFCNAAMAALALGEFAESANWALAGLEKFPCSIKLLNVFLQIQRARYDYAVERHVNALKSGRLNTNIEVDLEVILEQFLKARRASFGAAPLRQMRVCDRPLRVIMLANRDLPQCTFYRIDLKIPQLAAAPDIHLRVFDRSQHDDFRSAATTADIAIFYRLASSVDVLHCIAECRAMGVPTVYEIDDLMFDETEFPDALESYAGAISPDEHFGLRAGTALVRHAITACDAAIASTQALAERMRNLVRSHITIVHRNGLSASLGAIARTCIPSPPTPAGAPVTLFYGSGTRAHGADFRDLLLPALASLMNEYPQVRFIACGYVEAAPLASQFPDRVDIIAPIQDRDAYLSQFLSVDINLAVIAPTRFNHCKSEIKWLEAAAFGVPSVVSDVAGFGETLTDGLDVIRVKPDPQAWLAALRSLVGDPVRRRAVGVAARQRVLDCYALEALGPALGAGLHRVTDLLLAAPPSGSGHHLGNGTTVPAQPRRPRILLSNVVFPPQARGGATRIVRDQVAEMIARYASDYDVGILTGSDEETTPYKIEAYDWSGAPVWSIGCPFRPHMDWVAFDHAMAAPIDEILDRFQPDLLHAHCIQRLTATVLERAAARSVPYVVTVHDGWWISDHQFFTDDRGRLRMPWDAEQHETEANPHTRAESWARRLRLRCVLDGAEAVVAVSEPFAELYRRAGVGRTIAVPNGLPAVPPLEPTPPRPGRVRFAYLGGVATHKGYFLLRRAFCRGRFTNIDLLVADHSLDAGQEREEVWGTTLVRIIGLMHQDQIGKLYGMFDVLLAPSLWPESFGLVAREAMHYGKWVVATSLGSIGADIVPEENGWIVDPTKPDTLSDILAAIASDPEKFAQPPALRCQLRSVGDQVDELMRLYEGILRPKSAAPHQRRSAAPRHAPAKKRLAAIESPNLAKPEHVPPARHSARIPDTAVDRRGSGKCAPARLPTRARKPILAEV